MINTLSSSNLLISDDVSPSANMACMSCNYVLFSNPSNQKWVVDSGANQYMIAFESILQDFADVSKLNLGLDILMALLPLSAKL